MLGPLILQGCIVRQSVESAMTNQKIVRVGTVFAMLTKSYLSKCTKEIGYPSHFVG